MKKLKAFVYAVPFTVATAAFAQGDPPASLTSTLSTAAESAITGVVAVVGTILVAGMAIPVAKKVYRTVKSVLNIS